MPLIVEAAGLEKVFHDGRESVPALRGVTVQVEKGQFVAIIGPSGSGKTTLLHLMGGLDRPTKGSIIVDGTDLSRMSENELTFFRREKTGFIFQFFNLVPTLDVYENIALPFIVSARNRKEHEERVADMIELFGLRGREHRRATQLSAGEQQRVAIARAFLTEPALVIADEPTGNLDSATGIEILQLLWESCDNFGQSIVVVTHEPRVAAFADRVLFLQNGVLADELELGRREDHSNARPIIDRLQELGG